MESELYRKYRPTKFGDVVGQDDAIRSLNDMGRRKAIPHALLFTGPSGTGKTTLARILRDKMKCADADFTEMNAAADARGIETIRRIQKQINIAPMGGPCRIWLLDEVHQLTGDAQNGMLKILEDCPASAYFFLATTEPNKLKKTIITRCTEINCKLVGKNDLKGLVHRVAEAEGLVPEDMVIDKIADVADGSARKALVLLHSVLGIKSTEDQLQAVQNADTEALGIEIARALMKAANWNDVAGLLRTVKDEPETIRRIVLGYMKAVILNGGKGAVRAAMITEEFREPWYDMGPENGLVVSCWNVIGTG